MDINDLSKTQLLLLTILVSFVTSIATGVLTVSLLDEAPQTVTQTVNRIVDHTIETVTTQVPVPGKPDKAPSNEDKLVAAISQAQARVVTAYRDSSKRASLGTGLYLPSRRAVVMTLDRNAPSSVYVVFADGTGSIANRTGAEDVLVAYTFDAGAVIPDSGVANLVAPGDVKAGETAISLSGDGSAETGIVSLVGQGTLGTSIPQIPAGMGVVDINGDVIGIGLGGGGTVIATDRIAALLEPPAQ